MKIAKLEKIFDDVRVMTFDPGDHMSFDLGGYKGSIHIHLTAKESGDYEIEYSVDCKSKEEALIKVLKPFLHVVHEIEDDGEDHSVLYMKRKDTDETRKLCVLSVDITPA